MLVNTSKSFKETVFSFVITEEPPRVLPCLSTEALAETPPAFSIPTMLKFNVALALLLRSSDLSSREEHELTPIKTTLPSAIPFIIFVKFSDIDFILIHF